MTTPVQPDPDAGARFLEKLLADDPARLDVATDEQVVAMMDAAGVEAPEPETAEQVLARAERRARERAARAAHPAVEHAASVTKVKGAPPRMRKTIPRTAWVAGAIVAAAAAAIVAVEITSESKRGPEAIGPDRPAPPLTPAEQAGKLRDEAILACEFQDYAGCSKKLDEAKALDPAGESEPRVVEARKVLAVPPQPAPDPKVPLKPR
jgi:hypothetical protein